ncbi:MAG: hypothetical protein KAG37_03970 [Flavobacteriales bacterium]|nr:hypothetical protein [Flavobacteriales bacterium]
MGHLPPIYDSKDRPNVVVRPPSNRPDRDELNTLIKSVVDEAISENEVDKIVYGSIAIADITDRLIKKLEKSYAE